MAQVPGANGCLLGFAATVGGVSHAMLLSLSIVRSGLPAGGYELAVDLAVALRDPGPLDAGPGFGVCSVHHQHAAAEQDSPRLHAARTCSGTDSQDGESKGTRRWPA